MSNVVQFPTNQKKIWDIVVAGFMEPATQAGATKQQVDEFLKQFKPTFQKFQFEYQIKMPSMPEDVAQGVTAEMNKLQKAIQEHTMQLVMERLMFELKLFDWRKS